MDSSAHAWGRSTPDYWPEVSSQADPLNFAFPPPQSQLQSHLNSDLQQSWFSTSALPPAAASGGAYCWQTRYPPTYPPGPGSGLSRDSSRDDLTSVEFDQVFDYEERFRVDRRKLELLMMGRFDPIKDMATDYFQRIGDETNTTVIWPSRLKVGAKSKKDPHIRIGGQEEGVTMAKAMIMEHLDTKTRRVTMKMDVSYTDHSHIIGKGGNTIRRVMSETGCHIHFPDSNRSNPNEKSNQVSIAGREMEGVEKARARVRELTPLIFTFDLPIVSSMDVSLDPNDPYLRAIQDQYNIQLMFRQKQKNFHTTMAVVKGCEWEAARVKEATLLLVDHLCGGNAPSTPLASGSSSSSGSNQIFPVSMNMEISPVHHSVVLGKNNINLKVIMQRTKTTILFPDAGDPNIPPIRKGSVTITGAIHNVYSARQQLVGSMPLVMMFDMPDGIDVIDTDVQKIGEELDVALSIKPKHRQSNKSVLIKAQERNASAIYAARHRLLHVDEDEESLVVADIPETYKIQPISAQMMAGLGMNHPRTSGSHSPLHFPNAYNNNNNNNVYPSTSSASPLLPGPAFFGGGGGGGSVQPPYSPYLLPQQTPWAGASMNQSPFGNVLTPNHPYLQDYALLVLNNITRLQQQQLLEQQQQQQQQQQKRSQRGSTSDGNNNWRPSEANNNYFKVDKNGLNSPPINGRSPRNSSPVQDSGNLTNNLSTLDLNVTDKLMHLSLTDKDEDDTVISSSSGLGTSGGSGLANSSVSNTQSSSGDLNTFGHLFLDKFTDRRAPGCEMKTLQLAAQKQLDYDQKKLLASKAMQNKPSGEPRTPTPSWSGLGFSSSMPENVIKDKLAAEERASKDYLAGVTEEDEGGEKPTSDNNMSNLFKMGNATWFGNSSAFDAMLNPAKINNGTMSNGSDAVLPTDDLPTAFAKQGLAKYTDLFVRHEVDLQTFATLTEQDLREIGVQTFGARKKLLLLATKVKQILNEKW